MKVLIYSPLSLEFGGGGENWILEIASRLKSMGDEVIVATLKYNADEKRLSSNEIRRLLGSVRWIEIQYIPTPFDSSIGGLIIHPRGLYELIKIAKKVDVIYFINAHAQDLFMLFIKILTHKSIINAIHAPIFYNSLLHDTYIRIDSKTVMKFFDAHHALNVTYKKLFEKLGLKNVYLIPNGIDTQKFKNQSKFSPFKVLFVGRLTPQKGIDVLYEAIRIVNLDHKMLNNIEFRIVGSGSLNNLCVELAEKFSNIKYFGYISNEELLTIYATSNLFVMPSRWESFGIVVAEAQASYMPVVASNIPGPKDIIVDGVTGKLIKSEDPVALATAIKYFYNLWLYDYNKYKRICMLSRENAVKKFDWNVVTKEFRNMLHEVWLR